MMRLLVLPLILLLTGCDSPLGPQEPLTEQLAAIDGVVDVSDGEPIVVEVDTSLEADALIDLGEEIFDVTNKAGKREDEPAVQIVAGRFSSDIEYLHNGGGPQPGPPDLSWVRVLDGKPSIDSAVIVNPHVKVQLEEGADSFAWALQHAEPGIVAPEHGFLSVFAEGAEQSAWFRPGNDAEVAMLRAAVEAAETSGAELTTMRWDELIFAVSDADQARSLLADLEGGANTAPDIVIESPGQRWSGKLPELMEQLSGDLAGTAELVAETGSALVSTDAARSSYTVEAPGLVELEALIELLGSSRWAPGPDSMVSVTLAGGNATHPSRFEAQDWPRFGPILVSAHRAGLTATVVWEKGGGRRDRAFDVTFRNSPGVDLTTPDGYQRIIDVLRAHSWEGDAQIEISEGDHLYFWSSATGKADGAYFALHGAPSREPTGWAADFLAAWDATAG